MKNSILTVMKKEFTRFFTDRRMILTTLVMPGLMIYIVYSFMGTGLQSQFETAEDYTAKISVENLPESIRAMQAPISYTEISPDETEQALEDQIGRAHV